MHLVKGLSQREIARRLGISRNTVKRYCKGDNLPWEPQTRERERSVITPEVKQFIQECFEHDETAPAKQHHTAKRIYDRLVSERGFQGGESTIRQYVREAIKKSAPAFIPVAFDPGEAIQVDWGETTITINGTKQIANLFCMRLCSSAMPFVMAFP